MGRWPAGAQERLQDAAIALFAERGYERTTVADIAGGAGLTERSFYNHFSDKREVLFPDQDGFIAGLAAAVTAAPPERGPLDAITDALLSTADWFDERREAAGRRRRILDSRAELQEREHAKMAALDTALAGALRARGLADPSAALTATAAVAAYRLATETWLADPQRRTLGHHLRAGVADLRRAAQAW
ncbi:TetR/AcrR family transcriptional regulator [Pseudonocardia sp. HH130630-07]|uniref:TetR/AcrR family transcriptional regulator n=1 Tax=Pseudonocardia sp. HH130630-07 TaxID=1690815 RepID=UPI0008150A75|nr:TetR/AcrR family transcriptional regulator [Pseudonocardia sp. HH130630-07]ANY08253.1 TetR family transcriptional regulator [Pseudonocardia sp. HH130630-07]